jgi:hypothetical protein
MALHRILLVRGGANPIALLRAASMMLDHVAGGELAHQLRKAIDQTLNEDHLVFKRVSNFQSLLPIALDGVDPFCLGSGYAMCDACVAYPYSPQELLVVTA